MTRGARTPGLLVPAAIFAGAAVAASVLLGLLAPLPIGLSERIWLFMLTLPPLWACVSTGLLLAGSSRGWGLAGAAAAAGSALAIYVQLG